MTRKRRKGMPRRPENSPANSRPAESAVALVSYEVTWERLTDIPENRLPLDLLAEINRLYRLIHSRPREAIFDLECLIERYPDCPKLLNFLSNTTSGCSTRNASNSTSRKRSRSWA